jgi:hypothetical protein
MHTCDRVAMLQLEICKFLAGDFLSTYLMHVFIVNWCFLFVKFRKKMASCGNSLLLWNYKSDADILLWIGMAVNKKL